MRPCEGSKQLRVGHSNVGSLRYQQLGKVHAEDTCCNKLHPDRLDASRCLCGHGRHKGEHLQCLHGSTESAAMQVAETAETASQPADVITAFSASVSVLPSDAFPPALDPETRLVRDGRTEVLVNVTWTDVTQVPWGSLFFRLSTLVRPISALLQRKDMITKHPRASHLCTYTNDSRATQKTSGVSP